MDNKRNQKTEIQSKTSCEFRFKSLHVSIACEI